MTTIYPITGETLYQSDKPLKEALEEAVTKGVSLQNANLHNANLHGANLSGALAPQNLFLNQQRLAPRKSPSGCKSLYQAWRVTCENP